jgi:hypothetical protein
VDDLHVNGKLTSAIVEDEDTDGATARLESAAEAGVEVGLVNNRKTLLDVAGLGHGNDLTFLHVEDAVLLENRTEHGLNDNAGGRVGDERGLLVKLLGEEINTKVAVLTGGRGGRDADDLAGAALEHQEVTQANVVARDADGVGEAVSRGTRALVNVNLNIAAASMGNAITELVSTGAERVVMTCVVVVVTHLGLVVDLGSFDGFFRESHVLLVRWTGNRSVNGEVVDVSCLGIAVLGLGRAAVNSEVVDFSLLSGLVLRVRRSSVNSEVVDFSLLGGVLRSGRSAVNGEVVVGLLCVVVLRVRGASVNSEVVDFSLLGRVELGSGSAFNGVVVGLEVVLSVVVRVRVGSRVFSGKGLGRAVTLAVFTFSEIDGGGVVGMTVGVDLYVSVRSLMLAVEYASKVVVRLLKTARPIPGLFQRKP